MLSGLITEAVSVFMGLIPEASSVLMRIFVGAVASPMRVFTVENVIILVFSEAESALMRLASEALGDFRDSFSGW